MALRKEKELAIKLRMGGMSYSQIKQRLGIGKGTLSAWLSPYPLSEERIRELRADNPQRIERCRNTKARKKQERLSAVYEKAKTQIKKLNDREVFLAGMFLYWGEGYKTSTVTMGIANTDPAMLRFCIRWLKVIGAPIEKVKTKIHIYSDMDKKEAVSFWKKELNLPDVCFGQVYIKKSQLTGLTYKNGFGHGTCNLIIYNRDLKEYILSSLKYIREELSHD